MVTTKTHIPMISIYKIKLDRHDFDAMNAALQQFIPAFIQSNRKDIESLKDTDRDKLSRRMMLGMIDDLAYMLQKLAFRQSVTTISFKLSESEAIAMFYLLQVLPLHPEDVFTRRTVLRCIDELFHYLVTPTAPVPVSKIVSIEKVYR